MIKSSVSVCKHINAMPLLYYMLVAVAVLITECLFTLYRYSGILDVWCRLNHQRWSSRPQLWQRWSRRWAHLRTSWHRAATASLTMTAARTGKNGSSSSLRVVDKQARRGVYRVRRAVFARRTWHQRKSADGIADENATSLQLHDVASGVWISPTSCFQWVSLFCFCDFTENAMQ